MSPKALSEGEMCGEAEPSGVWGMLPGKFVNFLRADRYILMHLLASFAIILGAKIYSCPIFFYWGIIRIDLKVRK